MVKMNSKTMVLIVGIVAAIVGLIMIAYVKHEEIKAWLNDEETKRKIRELCKMAEQLITGTKKGQERLAWVVEQLRKYVPPNIAQYVTTEMLIKIINIIFDQIAVVMGDGSRKVLS